MVGIDDGGLTLEVEAGDAYLEVGGMNKGDREMGEL